MAQQPLILLPAYGRDYKGKPDPALADWKAGKDFKIQGGPYCSIRDYDSLAKMGLPTLAVGKGLYIPIHAKEI